MNSEYQPNQQAQARLSPSTIKVFRYGALLVCMSIGVQQLVPLWFIGPLSLPYLHLPLISLVMQFAGSSTAVAGGLNAAFALVMALYLLALVIFVAAFWIRTNPLRNTRPLIDTGLLAAQILLALLINAELLYIVAAELALLLALRPALVWLGLQAAMYTALHLTRLLHIDSTPLVCNVIGADVTPMSADQRLIEIGLNIVTGLAFQAIAFGVGYLAAAEQRRRARIAAAHAELLGTRQLLADAVRTSERVRIARDLHDAIGHHLTAINLHLDLAKRQAGNPVAESLEAAHGLALRLLAEVRKVVSTERAMKNPGGTQ